MQKRFSRLAAIFLTLALALSFVPFALAAETIQDGSSLTVTGTVRSITDDETPFYQPDGTPSYYTFSILTLSQPMEAVFNGSAQTVTEVQVSGFSAADSAKAHLGQPVTVTGTVVFAHTRYHYRDIVLIDCVVKDTPTVQQPAAPAQQPAQPKVAAKAGNIAVSFNGTAMKLGTYNIANNNYVKLRDVAQLLKGTVKEFSVTWNGAAQRIDLASGAVYTPEGGELAPLASGEQSATPSTASVWLDGAAVTLTAYTINNNNFFKLRDLGSALGFYVGWDGSTGTVIVDTSKGYSEEAPAAAQPAALPAISDQELLALAGPAGNKMKDMIYGVNLGALLEQDWDSPTAINGWDYWYSVIGCNSMAELDSYWHQHFSHKYTMDQVTGGNYKNMYTEYSGKLFTMCQGIGGDMETLRVDKVVSRNGDEVVFSGSLIFDFDDSVSENAVEFSLVYENGTWMCGYYRPIP